MRVVVTHYFADYFGRFLCFSVGPRLSSDNPENNSPVHRLETVAHVDRPADDNRHCIFHERPAHFIAHFNCDDTLAACSSAWRGRWLAAHLMLTPCAFQFAKPKYNMQIQSACEASFSQFTTPSGSADVYVRSSHGAALTLYKLVQTSTNKCAISTSKVIYLR